MQGFPDISNGYPTLNGVLIQIFLRILEKGMQRTSVVGTWNKKKGSEAMKAKSLICCFLIQLVFGAVSAQLSLAEESKSLKIAMILWRGETLAEQGLKAGLKELGYSVEYVTYNADQDKSKLAEILKSEIEPKLEQFDYIYCFGTTAAKMAQKVVGNKVPQFFNAVSAPVEAEIVKSMDNPGGNISGVTNVVPVEKQLEQIRKLVSFKKLGIMFNPREKNSVVRAEEAGAVSGKLNFEVVELNVAPEGQQLENTLQKLVDKNIEVDAVFLPSDSYLISQAKLIGEKLRQAKIPSFGTQKESIEGGALAGLVPDYYELGKLAAGIVDQNQKGKQMGEIPVAISKNPKLVVNRKTGEILGIQLAEGAGNGFQMVE